MNTVISDCGRKESGIKDKNDCSVRAVAAALGVPYAEAHRLMTGQGRKVGHGVYWKDVAPKLGFEAAPEFACRTVEKAVSEMSLGRFVVRTRGHVFAVVDGVIHDSHAGRPRNRVKMAYRAPGF